MRTFNLKKKGGSTRTIYKCDPKEKRILRRINSIILSPLQNKHCIHSHAYISGRNTYTNASLHIDKEVTICIDLKNFFDSVNAQAVFECPHFQNVELPHLNRVLQILNPDKKDTHYTLLKLLRDYCLVGDSNFQKCYAGQGLPTSPSLANIVFSTVDEKIITALKELDPNIVYSRYSDDLAISTNIIEKEFSDIVIQTITNIIKETKHFKINTLKTRVMTRKHGHRIICGLSVDKEVGFPKEIRKKLRALEHKAATDKTFENDMKGLKNYIENLPQVSEKFTDEMIDNMAEMLANTHAKEGGKWTETYELIFTMLKGRAGGQSVARKVFDLAWVKRVERKKTNKHF